VLNNKLRMIAWAALLLLPGASFAEGSRSLYPATYPASGNASRASLDVSDPAVKYANVVKRSGFLYVYAQAGEYILVGSSNVANGGAVLVYDPQYFGVPGSEIYDPVNQGTPDFTCSGSATSSPGNYTGGTLGRLNTRAMELAGPNSADNSVTVTNGYAPCAYQAPVTGVYGVVMARATSGGGPNGVVNPAGNFASSTSTVAAWDVTVRADATSTTDINGRLFTYAFVGFTGGNSRSLYSDLYYVTQDGYRYKKQLTGLDPNGYVLYSNSLGFLDNSQPLYKDLRGNEALVTSLPPGVASQIPQYPMFFSDVTPGGVNDASVSGVLTALSIPLVPPTPTVSNVAFSGNVSGSTSTIGTGGTLSFDTTDTISYQIVISLDGIDFSPDSAQNRTLTGIARTGSHTVSWDGRNNADVNFPVGGPYPFRIWGRNGEVHFPIIDAENNFYGGPIITRLNGTDSPSTLVHYDDRGYLTRSGILVGNLNGTLCPNPSPAQPVPNHDLDGIDSTTAYRTWGVASGTSNTNSDCTSSNAWGDAKALDLWTYYAYLPPDNTLSVINITIDVATTVAAPAAAQPGSTVQGTFRFGNNGTGTAPGVTYSMDLSPGLGSVTFGNLPVGTTATYDNATGAVTFGGAPLPATLTPGQYVQGVNPAAPMTFGYVAPASGPVTVATAINTTATTPSDEYLPNNSAVASTGIGNTDVQTTLSVPASVSPGGTVAGIFEFSNYGIGSAANVVYAATIGGPGTYPAAVTFAVLPTGVSAAYNPADGTVSFTGLPATLVSGQSFTFGFSYTAPAFGTIPVATSIATSTSDANAGNNNANGSTTIPVADVTTSLATAASASPGATVTVPISFGNVGQVTASGVVYSATLPAGLSNVTCSGATCSYSGTTVSITGLPASLTPGQSVNVDLSYTAPGSGSVAVASQIATATSQGANVAPDSANGSTLIAAGGTTADVTTSVTAPASAAPGGGVAVSIGFSNLGPASATGLTYSLTLPAGLSGVSCAGATCNYSGTTVSITGLPATLAAGQSTGITLNYSAPGTPSTVTVTSNISTSTNQGANAAPDSANDSTSVVAGVVNADVTTTVSPPAMAMAGATVQVPVSFSNNGPVDAAGVNYSLTLPAGLSGVSCSGATCNYSGTTVSISGLPSTLSNGQSVNMTLSYTAPASGPVDVTSTVATSTPESNVGNNSASAQTSIENAVAVPGTVHSIPTLDKGGLLLSSLLLALAGVYSIRRRPH